MNTAILLLLAATLCAPGDDLITKEAELAQLEADVASAPATSDPTAAMWRACALRDVRLLHMLIGNARYNENIGGYYVPLFPKVLLPYGGPYTHREYTDPIHNMLCVGRQHLNASLVMYPYPDARWSVLGLPPGHYTVIVPLP